MKFIARNTLIIAYLFLGISFSYAQTSMQGIYLTADDFTNNKISYHPVEGKKYKLHLNNFFNPSYLKISIGDSTFEIQKDRIFGYRDKENNVYRFYDKNIYKILNPSETILLYSKTALGGYKNLQSIVSYYFSSNAGSSIQTLTIWNLKNAFPNDTAFHELLDMIFHNDHDLMNYDRFYKMYKVNRVFQFSQQLLTTKNNQ